MSPTTQWADANGWQVITLDVDSGTVRVVALGPPPEISVEELRTALDDAGYIEVDLTVELVVGGAQTLPGSSA